MTSVNGGAIFTSAMGRGTTYVDEHAMWINPADPQHLYLGNDDGFYWSINGGASWNKSRRVG